MGNMNSYSKRYEVLAKLTEHDSEYLSGEFLGEELGISRAAVWKHVAGLREEGFAIEASSRKGYRLKDNRDIINISVLKEALSDTIFSEDILFFDKIDSTNSKAYSLAIEGAPEGTVLIADSQLAGRGRMGRQWLSPPGKGIWMSVILRPDLPAHSASLITLAAALSVAQAIQKVTGAEPGIKWPNDVLLEGKKVCGILTEMNTEIDKVHHIILGIGINFSQQAEDFPPEISDSAVSILMYLKNNNRYFKNYLRNDIIREVLVHFDKAYENLLVGRGSSVIEGWKDYSATIGKRICVHDRERKYLGKAVDIGQDGSLVLETEDGETRKIVSGEISIRGVMGYA